jgi:hypothetical protein
MEISALLIVCCPNKKMYISQAGFPLSSSSRNDYTVSFFVINHLTPNGHFSGRTAPLTYRCCIFLFTQ